ncbi:MAG: SDR family NAD(P)-dependent oxidoreductase [Caldilineaceae bacterium]|nr:SDR family NAD(P)-dependent oxidoreductase [Caldilineaceae bacterium]
MGTEASSPRITQLSPTKQAIYKIEELTAKLQALEMGRSEPIAIIGMGCRFPGGANSPDEFWQLLREGTDAISEVPAARWDKDAYYDADPLTPGKMSTRWGGFLSDVDQFDPHFFGISPREAADLDPQHRLLLEVGWEALEDAAQAPEQLAGSATGVFVGISSFDYGQLLLNQNPTAINAYLAQGMSHSTAAGRLSYVLGLQGPSVAVDTACSSSLMAAHLSIQSLRARECDMSLVGGVNTILIPELLIGFSKSQMMASDGRCKTFDAAADGFVRAEGCGVLVLKRLSDAEAHGDRILAIIRGSAANQDGRSNGLTAPNGPAQEDVIRKALANSHLLPREVGYVEAHGTGTSLGDPIEVQALGAVLGEGRMQKNPLLIGSVKTNLGHMEAAAGVAAMIKVVLALQHGQIPPHLHLHEPNPLIPWEELPIDVPTQLTPFPSSEGRSIAGVSSFGFSGTNVHLLLEAAPTSPVQPQEVDRPLHLLTLSAKNQAALQTLASRYGQLLAQEKPDFADFCFTANAGRSHFSQRLALVAASTDEAQAQLAAFVTGEASPGLNSGEVPGTEAPEIVFLFSGQGSQYVGMGRELYTHSPVFRQVMEECDALLRPHLPHSLLSVLYGDDPAITALLDETAYTQPALFAVEYALAMLWQSWGIRPSAVMGHSVGEYVAACVAGVMSLGDGLRLIAQRGRLMQALPKNGGMAAIFADEATVRGLLAAYAGELDLAALNGPHNIVISGEQSAVATVLSEAQAQGIKSRQLNVSHAFHSPLMQPILDEFESIARAIPYHPPTLSLMSNLTGERWREDVAPDAAYWCRHVRQAVRFSESVQSLHRQGYTHFLEIGPGTVLLAMAQRTLPPEAAIQVWPSLRQNRSEWEQMLETLAALYLQGADVDWASFDQPYARRRLSLPTYPFQRQGYWLSPPAHAPQRQAGLNHRGTSLHPLLGRQLRLAGSQKVFETEVSFETHPFVADHRVHGMTLFPAAGYIEMAFAAGRTLFGVDMPAVEALALHKPLILNAGVVQTLQLLLAPEGEESASFSIYSLADPNQEAASGEWQLHATGTLCVHAASQKTPLLGGLDEIRARCQEQMTAQEHYARLSGYGIELGPAFRSVQEIFKGVGEVVARISLPPYLVDDAARYQIHPALLDGSLQVFGATLDAGDATYMPISLARFQLYRALPEQIWSVLVSQTDGASSVRARTGDIYLLDAAGELVGKVEGLLLKQIERQAIVQAGAGESDQWTYQLEWHLAPLTVELPMAQGAEEQDQGADDDLLAPRQIVTRLDSALSQLQQDAEVRQVQEVLPALESLSTAYFIEALRALGWQLQTGERVSIDALAAQLEIAPQHRRLFERMLDLLAQDGYGKRDGTGWQAYLPLEPRNPQAHLSTLLDHYPAFKAELTLAGRCGRHWAEALQGKQDPLELLFPDGSLAEAEKMYHESPLLRGQNILAGEAVQAAISPLPKDRPVRILEIGAGTGGTTVRVLPHLDPEQAHYTFTDVSPLFVNRARARFQRFSFVEFRPLDIERPPESQGFASHQFDIVLAANVLHATADLRRTLQHVSDLLAPGGMMLLIEGTGPQRFKDLVVGLTEGWWKFTDLALRPSCALLPPQAWLALLEGIGFSDAAAIPSAPDQETLLTGEALIFASRPQPGRDELAQPKRWLVFADEGGVGKSLAQQLARGGKQVCMIYPGDAYQRVGDNAFTVNPLQPADFQRLLQEAVAAGALCEGVVHLWSLDATLTDEIACSALMAQQQQMVGSLIHLVQAVAQGNLDPKPRLWIVTRQTQHAGEGSAPFHPEQATMWGVGRVLALNYPAWWGGLIDLEWQEDRQEDIVTAAAQVQAEIEQAHEQGEDQVAWRGAQRYVARLVQSRTPAQQPLRWQSDGSYLITGGLGSLGRKVAAWLAQQGAQHLVLASRTPLPDRSTWSSLEPQSAEANRVAAVQAIEAMGASVTTAAVDVGDAQEMAALFDRFGKELPPLAGLFHAAAAGESVPIEALSLRQVMQMFQAKVGGSWLLHQLTRDLDLDYFVLFSSTTALLGASDLAHYAAANCFLDALAHYRHAHALPALAVNWGTWRDSDSTLDTVIDDGMMHNGAAVNGDSPFTRFGLEPMEPARALGYLGELLGAGVVQQAVASVNWPRLRSVYEVHRTRRLLAQLHAHSGVHRNGASLEAASAPTVSVEQPLSLRQRLESALPADRQALLMGFVRDEVATVLGQKNLAQINVQQGLFEMGLDSLMAVELRSRLERAVGQRLPATLTFNYPNIHALTKYLQETLFVFEPAMEKSAQGMRARKTEGDAVAAANQTGNPFEDGVEHGLDDISAEELLGLLDSELAAIDDLVKDD